MLQNIEEKTSDEMEQKMKNIPIPIKRGLMKEKDEDCRSVNAMNDRRIPELQE